MADNKVLPWVSQAFVERMVKMGKPSTWTAPYVLRGGIRNFVTDKAYRGGMNLFLLSMAGDNFFAGGTQAKKKGLTLPSGALANYGVQILVPILGYYTKENDDGTKEKGTYVKGFSMCTVYPLYAFEKGEEYRAQLLKELGGGEDEHAPDYRALEEELSIKLDIPIQHEHQAIAYARTDKVLVNMPDLSNLKGTYAACRVLFHEIGHALVHKGADRGENKGMEEAIAELFSMMASADHNLPIDMENTMAYLWSWLKIPDDAFDPAKGFRKFHELEPEERTIVTMVTTAMNGAQARLSLMNKLIREFVESPVTA